MKRICSIALSLIIALLSFANAFAGTNDIDAYIEGILDYRMETSGAKSLQQLVSGAFASSPASNEDWYIFALRNYTDEINYEKYRRALEDYAANNKIDNVTTRQRAALVLLSIGSQSDFTKTIVDETAGELGLMSWIFALHLLSNNAASSKFDIDSVIDKLTELQFEDGGWAAAGTNSDTDASAMVLQALAPYKDDERLVPVIEKTLDLLSSRQSDDGSYTTFGNKNPESGAQVLMALANLGIDGLTDERFIKNGHTLLDGIELFRLPDGSFSHTIGATSNKNSTAQVLYSLISYKNMKNGKNLFYVFDELKEPELADDVIDETTQQTTIGIKTIIIIAIAILTLAALVLLFIKGKRNIKSYIGVIAAGIILCAAAFFINFESTGNFYKGGNIELGEKYITTTLSIRCDCIAGQKDHIPGDGIIIDFASVILKEGSSAYDQIIQAAKDYRIHTDIQAGYVKGIGNIYEFDFGDLSGWMFKINGNFAGVSCSDYILTDNDYIEWIYSLELGKDLGTDVEKIN